MCNKFAQGPGILSFEDLLSFPLLIIPQVMLGEMWPRCSHKSPQIGCSRTFIKLTRAWNTYLWQLKRTNRFSTFPFRALASATFAKSISCPIIWAIPGLSSKQLGYRYPEPETYRFLQPLCLGFLYLAYWLDDCDILSYWFPRGLGSNKKALDSVFARRGC